MDIIAFLLGHGLLAGLNVDSVIALIEKQGETAARNYLHTQAQSSVTKHATGIAVKMKSDGWAIGKTYRGQTIDATMMVHDVLYRIVALFIPKGGLIKDQIRDGLGHKLEPELSPNVPTGDPTEEWVKAVGLRVIEQVF